MAIEVIEGDLLDAFDKGEVNVIGHCCNAQGVMGSGIALSIKQRYPLAYAEYRSVYANGIMRLGDRVSALVAEGKVDNLVAQEFYGRDGKRYLNYGALGRALQDMAAYTSKEAKIGFPFFMGCYRAGGDWAIVFEMIEYYFKNHNVRVYKCLKN